MVSVYLDNYIALLDTFLLVDDFLIIFLISVIFSKEYETFSITSWCDKHHMDHIFSIKSLMMRNFAHKVIMLMDLSLRVILLNEVIYEIGRVHDLLLRSATTLFLKVNKTVIFLPLAALLVLVLKASSSGI